MVPYLQNRLGIGTTTILSIVLAFTVAAMLLAPGAGAQEAGDAGSNMTITADATGTVSAPPDLAVIYVAVEASADSADAARATVANKVSEMREALDEANVSDDQIRTTYFNMQTERDDDGIDSYRATHGFELQVPVDDAGSVVDTSVAGGATRVHGVQFTLTEGTSRELRNDALRGALTNARADANAIASASGVEVQAVKSVETGDGGVSPVFTEATRGDQTTFDPGAVTVTAHVTVTYIAS